MFGNIFTKTKSKPHSGKIVDENEAVPLRNSRGSISDKPYHNKAEKSILPERHEQRAPLRRINSNVHGQPKRISQEVSLKTTCINNKTDVLETQVDLKLTCEIWLLQIIKNFK